MSNTIGFFTFENYHGKTGIGSTRIRAHNLIKYWPEANVYRFGEKPDVMIYQKVYGQFDYKVPFKFPAIRILDICDPDFKDSPDIFIKETMDAMDAIVVPTETLKDFLGQITDTPIRVIKDRFDISEFPKPKVHTGQAKKVVWFGYEHNSGSLKMAMGSLERRGLETIIISDRDPEPYHWTIKPDEYKDKYTYYKFSHPEMYEHMQEADICILPKGVRPLDMFKSENKTIIAQLLGLPVATNADELDALIEADARNQAIETIYDKLKQDYDCKRSIEEYKELIDEIKNR